MTREYAPTRPIGRRRLTTRGRVLLYAAVVALSLLAGLTADVWDPFARTLP